MRRSFAQAMLGLAADADCFFLTNDLGFMALEEVRAAFGTRFVNAGVAEQNMVGVGAGLARSGFRCFLYSIAPFCYARPFEQIRNDLCPGNLPVCLVGNGGGYAYGYMGPTHHALEDCAVMCALGLRVLVPAFDDDIPALVTGLHGPTYLRLGYDERPSGTSAPAWAPWRRILGGEAGALVCLGPLAGIASQALLDRPSAERPAVWTACELPLASLPAELEHDFDGKPLYVIEEHVAAGGLGAQLAMALIAGGKRPSSFVHRPALGYPDKRFGSQAFHRKQCGIDGTAIHDMTMARES